MNEFIKILENNKDNYFFGEVENLKPFVSGEFLQKFEETILANDNHCKYNFNDVGYSEFNILFCKNPNKIKYIDIIINKKGNQYDKVRCMFEKSLDVQKVKKIFIGHTETKIIEKEKFYSIIKNSEIELFDFFDDDDKEEVLNSEWIYKDYLMAVEKYNIDNKNRIDVEHKFGNETEFYFDLYGNLKEIWICEDYGYESRMSITIEYEKQEVQKEQVDELAPASEQAINELLNLFN